MTEQTYETLDIKKIYIFTIYISVLIFENRIQFCESDQAWSVITPIFVQ